MKLQTVITTALVVLVTLLAVAVIHLFGRVQQAEQRLQNGQLQANAITARRISVVNPNGVEVIRLESDPHDASGYGDGFILVNEGQGTDNPLDKLQASVQIRGGVKLGSMVVANSHRIYQKTADGRLKLVPIHTTVHPESDDELASGSNNKPKAP